EPPEGFDQSLLQSIVLSPTAARATLGAALALPFVDADAPWMPDLEMLWTSAEAVCGETIEVVDVACDLAQRVADAAEQANVQDVSRLIGQALSSVISDLDEEVATAGVTAMLHGQNAVATWLQGVTFDDDDGAASQPPAEEISRVDSLAA